MAKGKPAPKGMPMKMSEKMDMMKDKKMGMKESMSADRRKDKKGK